MMQTLRRRFSSTTVDAKEVAKFGGLDWWSGSGGDAMLREINRVRLRYLAAQFPETAVSLVDVGCGGGLVAEPLARRGHSVLGIDFVKANVEAARAHAARDPLLRNRLKYEQGTVEALAQQGRRFGGCVSMEVLEHVADVTLFLKSCADIVEPGGTIIVSTLNRTSASYLLGIVAAEYLLGWVPAGTHDWQKFITPTELSDIVREVGLEPIDWMGLVYDPLSNSWRLDPHRMEINYFLTAKKRKE